MWSALHRGEEGGQLLLVSLLLWGGQLPSWEPWLTGSSCKASRRTTAGWGRGGVLAGILAEGGACVVALLARRPAEHWGRRPSHCG